MESATDPHRLRTTKPEKPGGGAARTEGSRLGRYALLERIGTGGMGVVYAAYDPELDRRVALKLLRQGQDGIDPRERARLVREAQTLARVSHPNVITVYDVGTVEDQVFLAMELVEGQDLRAWLRTGQHSYAEALELLVQAGRGLEAAHRAGLVHRDFKPGNVLVGDDGITRVVDFGLARRLDTAEPEPPSEHVKLSASNLSVSDEPLTRTGTIAGTPAYMAPEQHSRGELTPKTDQFSFCVTAYEALYGRRPFEGSQRVALMMATNQGEILQPPRTSGVPDRIWLAIRRGLSPRPADRFDSMEELLAQLEPKAQRRARGWGLGVAAVAGLGVFAWAVLRDDGTAPCQGAASSIAEVWNEKTAHTISEAFATTGLPYADDAGKYVVGALDRYADQWVRGHTEACEATRVRGEQSQEMLDRRMICLERRRGELAALVDELARADALAVERAPRAVAGLADLDTCADLELLARGVALPSDPGVRTLVNAANEGIARARALGLAGKAEMARTAAAAVVVQAEAIEYSPLLADALYELSRWEANGGDKHKALETLHLAAQTAAAAGADRILVRAWTEMTYQVGLDHSRHEEALRWAGYARALLERIGSPLPLQAQLMSVEGAVLWASSDFEGSADVLKRVIELRRAHDLTGADLAANLVSLGNSQLELDQLDEAEASYREAHEIAQRVHGGGHPLVAAILSSLGVAAFRRGKLDEALDRFQTARGIMVRAVGPNHPDLLFSLGNTANALRELGRYDEALAAFDEVLALVRRTFPAVHRDVGMTLHNIGTVLLAKGEREAALTRFREALTVREQVHGKDDILVANTLTAMGEALTGLGRTREAREHLDRALAIREAKEKNPRRFARTRFALARALDRGERAVELARAARSQLVALEGDEVAARRLAKIEAWLGERGANPTPP